MKMVHGNNTETVYSYDNRRRMNTLSHTFTGYGINKQYSYDALSNITCIKTLTPENSLPGTNGLGGPINHKYKYDNYNRLEHAEGNYTGPNDLTTPYVRQWYELDMTYNSDHTIKTKAQVHYQGLTPSYGGAVTGEVPVRKNSYKLDYSGYRTGQFVTDTNVGSYGYLQPHAVRKIMEKPAGAGEVENDHPQVRHKEIVYDANGNQLEIKEKLGEVVTSLRKNLWDEENRLAAVDLRPDDKNIHPIAVYTYDAGGQRVVRYNHDHIDAYSNAVYAGNAMKDNVMLYPSGLLMCKAYHDPNRGKRQDLITYTKHYYAGSERLSAKTGTLKYHGAYPDHMLPTVLPKLAESGQFTGTDAGLRSWGRDKADAAGTTVDQTFSKFGHDEFVLVPGRLPQGDEITAMTYTELHDAGKLDLYYFHPDHLGSSSYITNGTGKVSQHMEYLPFGETLADEHSNSHNSPFKFNGKEFDEETGNYYYSARYYDPKWSIFISVDPLAEKTMDAYGYCYQNPINLVDPSGMNADIIEIGKNSKYFRITKAEGADVVKLVNFSDDLKEKTTVASYVYGENGSFKSDTYDRSIINEYKKRETVDLHFHGSADKADKIFKFAADANYEWGLTDVFYSGSGYGETIVRTDFQQISVEQPSMSILDASPDAIITRLAHSHPIIGVPYPSGFHKNFSPDPSFDGDRNRYIDLQNSKYRGRVPEYNEVHISWKNFDLLYNDKNVIKK